MINSGVSSGVKSMVFPIILGVVASLIHLIKSLRFLDFCIGSISF